MGQNQHKMSKPALSIAIPCYNEAHNIPLILKRFAEVKGELDLEVILVNNGSTDNSEEVLKKELQKPEYSFARTVLVPNNVGYGHGIMFGIRECKSDIIGYTHADMQCDPVDTIRAYNILCQQNQPKDHLVKGWRRNRKTTPKLLALGYQAIATTIFFRKYTEINAQPKIFHKDFLKELQNPPLNTNLDFYILHQAKKDKKKVINILVDFPDRKHGQSKVFSSLLARVRVIRSFFTYLVKLRFLGERKAAE